MKIALFSDIHTEFYPGSQVKDVLRPMLHGNADVVVLAGDIASGRHNVKQVLNKFAEAYPHVVYVPGNHEYYGSSTYKFDQFGPVEDNIHILNPGLKCIDGVNFIGATLWTNFHNDPLAEHAAKQMIVDFRRIENFTPQIAKERNTADKAFIKALYENVPGKKVIVTHFLPAYACVSERFRDGNLLNKYFANDMDSWIYGLSNTTWLYGHTHDCMDFMLGDTRMVCNPYGYPGEKQDGEFSFEKVIEV